MSSIVSMCRNDQESCHFSMLDLRPFCAVSESLILSPQVNFWVVYNACIYSLLGALRVGFVLVYGNWTQQ